LTIGVNCGTSIGSITGAALVEAGGGGNYAQVFHTSFYVSIAVTVLVGLVFARHCLRKAEQETLPPTSIALTKSFESDTASPVFESNTASPVFESDTASPVFESNTASSKVGRALHPSAAADKGDDDDDGMARTVWVGSIPDGVVQRSDAAVVEATLADLLSRFGAVERASLRTKAPGLASNRSWVRLTPPVVLHGDRGGVVATKFNSRGWQAFVTFVSIEAATRCIDGAASIK
jgi:hypothetical protein